MNQESRSAKAGNETKEKGTSGLVALFLPQLELCNVYQNLGNLLNACLGRGSSVALSSLRGRESQRI